MENLHSYLVQQTKLPVNNPNKFSISYNCNKTIVFVSTDNNCIHVFHEDDCTITDSFQFDGNIINFEYLIYENSICVAIEDGRVFLQKLTMEKDQIEAAFCSDGIVDMKVSPDQEMVVFLTKQNNIVLMNSSLDVVAEQLISDEFGENKFIQVGWGKEETQFLGSTKTHIDKREISSIMEINSFISWREDSEYFAVLFSSTKRQFKVYSKDGVLKFTSEPGNGLGKCFAWRPSGNWIAIPEVKQHCIQITLFEKNGLRHGEFILPTKSPKEIVHDISWSSDSDILLVQTKLNNFSFLYLFTVSNYHWYLKLKLNFKQDLVLTEWKKQGIEKKVLHILLKNGSHLTYHWSLKTAIIEPRFNDENGLIGVINGNQLQITAFAEAIIPPPMCCYTLTCENVINFVKFSKFHDDIFLLTVDDSNNILVYECTFFREKKITKLIDVLLRRKTTLTLPVGTCYNWCWLTKDEILFVNENIVYKANISAELSTPSTIYDFYNNGYSKISGVEFDSKSVFFQDFNGKIIKINGFENVQANPEAYYQLSQFCNSFCITSSNEFCSLSVNNNLYVNENQIYSGVTSYLVLDRFLVFTIYNELHFYDLDKHNNIYTRKIENGAKIVSILPQQSKIVLQMPRGNLEVIFPRILVIRLISVLLDKHDYKEAYKIIRRQRINLNLILDHNPSNLIENLEKFLFQINNVQWINLFISELENTDVTVSCYSNIYSTIQSSKLLPSDYDVKNKINYICDKLIKLLSDEEKYKTHLLSIVTCYIKKGDLENALNVIWNLKVKEIEQSLESKHSISSDEAFKYLLYLVDVNELYNVALGTYDFGQVLFVAKRSQKDPKEYINFLKNLNEMDENYKKFTIDCHLKRFSKAVANISKYGKERLTEALELIKKYELYSVALKYYRSDEFCYKQVCLEYGHFLVKKNRMTEASVFFEKANELQFALKYSNLTLNWKRSVMLMKQMDCCNREQCIQLLNILKEHNKYLDASDFAISVIKDTKLAIDLLIEGNYFLEAIQVAKVNGVEMCGILKNLENYIASTKSSLENELLLFRNQLQRLKVVREEKDRSEKTQDYDGDDDIFSDSTSIRSSIHTTSSQKSSSSFRSKKNRRKHEKKLLNLKQGNKYEDLALINSMYSISMQAFNTEKQQHVKETCLAALDLDLIEESRGLQKAFRTLQDEITESLDEIWLPELNTINRLNVDNYNDYFFVKKEEHYAMLDDHLRFKPKLEKTDWELHILQ